MAGRIATLDLESYSEAGFTWNDKMQKWEAPPGASQGRKGLSVVGAFVYWEHPTADVLTLRYKLPDHIAPAIWKPGMPQPAELFDWLAAGGEIEFHNAMFEKLGWHHVLAKRYGFPPLDPARVHCSMATAHVNGYPGGLAALGDALGADLRKDPIGDALIKTLTVPRNPTKGDERLRIRPTDTQPVTFQGVKQLPATLFAMLDDYCGQDVLSEEDAAARMEPMTPDEREAWQLDQMMNWRGVAIDRRGVRDCIVILEQAIARYGSECERLTGGLGPSQVTALVGWIKGRGVQGVDSLGADDVESHLKREDLPADVRRVLEIRQLVGSAAVKKLYAMENRTSADDRLRGLFIHHGTRTGRPTGEGVQTTNMVRAGVKLVVCPACGKPHRPDVPRCPWCATILPPPDAKPHFHVDMVDPILEIMSFHSLDMVEQFFGDAVATLQALQRPMLQAGDGLELISSDYSAIEAVVAACIAGEQWRIDTFRRREDIYLQSASKVTGKGYDWYLAYHAQHGEHHFDRQLTGKILELSCGFGGFIGSWRSFDPDADSKTDAEIRSLILAWRDASPAIVEMWGGQRRRDSWRDELYGIEGAFIKAVQSPGSVHTVGPLQFYMTAPFGQYDRLKMRLPSGRELTYHQPILTPSQRRPGTLSISYMTDNSNPKYGALGWVRMETWGSRIFENAVQAIAHDIMRYARKNLIAARYMVVQEVYDEAVGEVPLGWGSIEHFEQIMATLPPWAALPDGTPWPIRASGGWRGKRYRKG